MATSEWTQKVAKKINTALAPLTRATTTEKKVARKRAVKYVAQLLLRCADVVADKPPQPGSPRIRLTIRRCADGVNITARYV